MKYAAAELIQIVPIAGTHNIYHNTIAVFPSVEAAKAYAEARTYTNLGKTPLHWTNTGGNGWAAYKAAPNTGIASWQIMWVEFEIDDRFLAANTPAVE